MFIVKVKFPNRTHHRLFYTVSEDFDEVRKKFLSLYGENLISIEWKNSLQDCSPELKKMLGL